jgi:hypothetical protein
VLTEIPDDMQFMCSADYETHPVSQLHVIPTYNEHLDRYVGSYRCDRHWAAALSETRARLRADVGTDELAMLLEVILARGVTVEQLRELVAEKSPHDAGDAVLDALATGQLRLTA